jgi:hypothetical protein
MVRASKEHDYARRKKYMPTITTKGDGQIETVYCKTGTDTVCPKSGESRNLLGLLIALGAGIAYGLVLAICFMEGQSEGAASVKTLVSDSSLTRHNAAPGDESVRPRHAIVSDKELGSAARQMGDQLWPDPNAD